MTPKELDANLEAMKAAAHVHAVRYAEARQRSSGERNYVGAVKAARQGKKDRLIDLLRARRPLNQADFEALADYVEQTTAKRPRGQPRKEHLREAAREAERVLKAPNDARLHLDLPMTGDRDEIVKWACKRIETRRGEKVDIEAVHALLRRPIKRRT